MFSDRLLKILFDEELLVNKAKLGQETNLDQIFQRFLGRLSRNVFLVLLFQQVRGFWRSIWSLRLLICMVRYKLRRHWDLLEQRCV